MKSWVDLVKPIAGSVARKLFRNQIPSCLVASDVCAIQQVVNAALAVCKKRRQQVQKSQRIGNVEKDPHHLIEGGNWLNELKPAEDGAQSPM
jgi:hypothetical protein